MSRIFKILLRQSLQKISYNVYITRKLYDLGTGTILIHTERYHNIFFFFN